MTSFLRLALVLALAAPLAQAAAPDHWVGTWATADVDRPNTKGDFADSDTTLRQIVHVSLGGSIVRIELSNQFGTESLAIGAVHIALAGATKGDIALPSANAITFGGRPTITIPPGAHVLSDPAAINLPAMSDLSISIEPDRFTVHPTRTLEISQHIPEPWQGRYRRQAGMVLTGVCIV